MKLGNPALIAASSNPDLVKSGKDVIVNYHKQAASTARVLIMTVAGAVVTYAAYTKYKNWRRQKFVEENAHLPDVQAAMVMRKAMFRVEFTTFPFNYISIPDGTNEAMLNALALKVSSVQNVVKAYKILFDANLYVDVANELSDNDLKRFFENLGASNDYATQFGAGGAVKPQTPYKVGQTIYVRNPDGATVWKAVEKSNGTYAGSNQMRDFKKFNDKIGTIVAVYKGTSGQHYYVVDMDWSADFILGYGWVGHTEVKT